MIQASKVEKFVPFGREYCLQHPFSSDDFPINEEGEKSDGTLELSTDEKWSLTVSSCDEDCEEELYIKRNTVVWSKGSSQEAKVVYKSYTAKSKVKNAMWCTFLSPPSAQEKKHHDDNYGAKAMHSLCVVQDDSIDVLTSEGSLYITPLPFPVSHVWTISGGLLLERSLNAAEMTSQHREVPTIFSVMHPLDEPRPVSTRSQGKPSYVCDPSVSVVFSSEDGPIVMTYDSEIGLHSLWRIRKAKPEDYPDFPEQTQVPLELHSSSPFCIPTPLLSSVAHSRLSTATPTRHFSPLKVHTPVSTSKARYAQSPASFLLMSPSLSHMSPLSETPAGSLFRSPPTSNRGESFWEGCEPLLPDVCLTLVWQEAPLVVRHGIRGKATKAFTTTDFCGVNFLCYLIGHLDKLRGIQYELRDSGFVEVKSGPGLEISAKDAVPLKHLDMMLLLDLNHSLILYSGFVKVCQVNLPYLMISEDLRHLSTPWQGKVPEVKVKGETSALGIRGLNKSVVSLRDPAAYSCNGVLTDGSLLKISFSRLAENAAVLACLEAAKFVLPSETALQTIMTYYNSVCSTKTSTDTAGGGGEEERFTACMAELMGLPAEPPQEGNMEAQPESPVVPAAKKSKTQDSSAEVASSIEDWAWLLRSTYHKQVEGRGVGLRPMPPTEAFGNVGSNTDIRLKEDAILFPWIPTLLYAWHLVYEELKLNVQTSTFLYPLGKFLCLLARTVDWPSFVDYYCRDHPSLASGGLLDKPAAHQDQLKIMKVPSHVSEEPPSVHQWICARLKGSTMKAFPLLRSACKQTYLILKMYSILVPLDDENSATDQDRIFTNVPGSETYPVRFDSIDSHLMEKLQRCQTNAEKVVLFMAENGFTAKEVDSLPFGISTPLREAMHECMSNPPLNLPAVAYELIGRQDLSAQVSSTSHPNQARHTPLNQTAMAEGEVDDGMAFDQEVVQLRFGKDLRVQEVRRLLQSAKPVQVTLVQKPEVSDHDFIQEQEARLLLMCRRTMALPVGRGMFTLATSRPVLTETLPVPSLELNGRAPPRNTVVSLEHIDAPADMRVWPEFHNGVAAGLRIAPGISEIDRTWIAYNKPKDNQLTNEHAGFLMALGLNGHINSLAFMNLHDYLCVGHELTSVGILLGMSIAKRGTMDIAATRVLSIHLDALLPPTSAELDLPHSVQVAALLGVGLLYQGTAHRRMAEVLLSEIGRPPGPEMENAVNRESYSLASGLALGLVMLEQGDEPGSVADLKIADNLYHYMVGGQKKPQTGTQREKFKSPSYQIKEGNSVNIDVTSAGATLALGLMFMKTNNRSVAAWLSAPDTQFLLDFVRPDLLLLRLLCRGLIMWESVLPSVVWVESHIPAIVQKHAFSHDVESGKVDDGDLDFQTLSQAQANIIAGCCLVIGLRFAGSANQEAFNCLMHYTKFFRELLTSGTAEQAGKPTVETCLDIVLLALSLVMAGTGNLDVLRIARQLHKRHSPDVHYGSHMAVHMAIGLLFLGGGRYTLCTSGPAVAALVCALYPKFPISSTDNRYHLQAFRHLYVLAAEPRVIVPREVDTGKACYAPLEVTLKASQYYPESTVKLMAPCIIPELHFIKKISVVGPRYLSITVELGEEANNASLLTSKLGTVYVKRRAGYLAYVDDPKGYRNLLARTFAAQTEKTQVIRSFSSDPQIIALAELFCDNVVLSPEEKETTSFVTSVLLECVTAEKLEVLKTYLQVYQAINELYRRQDPHMIWEIKLVLTYYHRAFPRSYDNGSKKPLLSEDFIAECKVRAEERIERLVDTATVPASTFFNPTEYRKHFSPALACFLVYHEFPLQPVLASSGKVGLAELIHQNEDLPFAMATLLL